jgi:hypothetical protein
MIWTLNKLQERTDDEGDEDSGIYRSRDRDLRCKYGTVQIKNVKSALIILVLLVTYALSGVVIVQVGCPDVVDCSQDISKSSQELSKEKTQQEHPRFYCRTHSTILDYMNLLVYLMVGSAVGYSVWVFLKKFGMLLDSFGQDKHKKLDDDTLDMLHKGMVGTANAWAADPRLPSSERAKAHDVMSKIKQFKIVKGIKYDANFARFFKDEEVYTVYAWLIQAEESDRSDLKWFVDELTEKKLGRDFKLLTCPNRRCDSLCCKDFREWCVKRNRPASFFENFDADATAEATEAETWGALYDLQQQMTERERFLRFGEKATDSMMELQELTLEGREDNEETRRQLGLQSTATHRLSIKGSAVETDLVKKNQRLREAGKSQLGALGRDVDGALGSKKLDRKSESSRLSLGTKRRSSSQSSADLDTVEESSWAIGGGGGDASSSSWNPFAAGSGWGKYEKEPEPEPEPDLVLGGFSSTEPAAAPAKSGLLGALFDRGGRSKAKAAAQQEVEMISVDRFQSPFATELFGDSGANTSHAFATAEPSKKELKKMAKESEKLAKSAQKSAKKTEQQERKLDKQQEKEERKRVQAKTKGKDNEWGVTHTHTAAEKAKRTSTAAAKEKLKEKKQARSSSSGGGGGGGGGGRASGGGGDPFESSFGSIGGADEFDDPATSKETKKKKKKKKKKKGDDGDDDWMRTTNIMQSHDRGGF